MALFVPMPREEIIRAMSATDMEVDLSRRRLQIKARREKIHRMFEGGMRAVYQLKRKSGESERSFIQRQQNFRNVRFVAHIAESFARLLYAKPPKREFWVGDRPPSLTVQVVEILRSRANPDAQQTAMEREDAEVQDRIRAVYKSNNHRSLFLGGAEKFILDETAPIKVWFDDERNMAGYEPIRMDFMSAWDAIPIVHPDDPDTVIGAWEYRGNERWRIWDGERWDWVAPNGAITGEGAEHRLGRLPFEWLGGVGAYSSDGGLWLDDAADMQDRLINRESTNYAVTRAQGFPVPVLKSNSPLANQVVTDEQTGEKGYRMNWDELVEITDPEGNFWFANPNADLDKLTRMFHADWSEGLRTYDLPDNITTAISGVEQPMAMRFRWMAALGRRDALIPLAVDFERNVAEIVARYINEWDYAFDVEDFQAEISFPEHPFPEDKRADMDADMRLVESGLMLKADFIVKWVVPNMSDPEMVAQYIEQLGEQEKANRIEPTVPQINIPGFPPERATA